LPPELVSRHSQTNGLLACHIKGGYFPSARSRLHGAYAVSLTSACNVSAISCTFFEGGRAPIASAHKLYAHSELLLAALASPASRQEPNILPKHSKLQPRRVKKSLHRQLKFPPNVSNARPFQVYRSSRRITIRIPMLSMLALQQRPNCLPER